MLISNFLITQLKTEKKFPLFESKLMNNFFCKNYINFFYCKLISFLVLGSKQKKKGNKKEESKKVGLIVETIRRKKFVAKFYQNILKTFDT